MSIILKQSTASQEIPLGYFLDSSDGDTEEIGLTIANTDIKLWKSGATTLANKNSGGATHILNGIYYCVLDATDTNTLGSLIIFIHVSGALAIKVECDVLAANVYDSRYGLDRLLVDVREKGDPTLALTTQEKADVLTQVNAAWDAANTELGSIPTTTGSLRRFMQFVFQYLRNQRWVTSTTETLYKENASTPLGTAALSDDGTTFKKGEMN